MKVSNVSLISTLALVRVLGGSSVWVYTSVYMNHILGIPLYTVGIIFTISGVISAFAQVYGGRIGDKFGYKRIMLVSSLVSLTLYSSLFIASSSGNYPALIPILFISGQTANVIQRPSSNALLALSSNKPLRSFSFLRVGANIGWGIGPAIGGFAISFLGYPSIFAFAAMMMAISTTLILRLERKEPAISHKKRLKFSSLPMGFILLGISGLLLYIVQAQESVTLVNYAATFRHLQTSELGFIYFTNGFSVLVFQGLVYKLSKRMTATSVFVTGAFIYSIGYFTMSFDTALPYFIISMAGLSLGEDFAFPMGNAIISRLYKDRDTGFYMGAYNAFLSIGRSVGPAIGGFALAFLALPYQIWLLVTIPGFASALVFYFGLSGRLKQVGSIEDSAN